MRFSALFAASFVSFAAAASIADYPACALSCLTTANYGTCDPATLDQKCLCQSQEFITSSTTCIRQSCSAEDDATAAQVSNELCAEAGVTVSFTATATASAEQTASAAASSAASAATSAQSRASASVSAATSSIASVISSASVAAASATTSANAAPTNVVGRGAMVAGMVAAAALAL
ncbi:hypothetical protein FS837_009489 [Tulasnella sp. UAMH 9824]|nr:hypothetical protein FS837_009489 [Tulasnella sp. UAMH 9824]